MLKKSAIKILISIFCLQLVWVNFAYAGQFSNDKLIVVGNQLKLNNKSIILRGVAMGDPYSRVVDHKRNGELDYLEVKKWQANVVRLSVHPGNWLRDNERTKIILANDIALARKNGLIVMVDWHVIGSPDGWFRTNDNDTRGYTFESSLQHAVDFWEYMAQNYKDDRGVMFEIWNEPMDLERRLLWSDFQPAMQTLCDDIRKNGAENVIVVPGVNMAKDLQDISKQPMKDNNIMYSWHSYPDNVLRKEWLKNFANLSDKYPVMVSEWGFSPDSSAKGYGVGKKQKYFEPMTKLIKDKKLHFTAWTWHGTWQPPLVKKDWRTPTEWGKLLKKFLSEYKK